MYGMFSVAGGVAIICQRDWGHLGPGVSRLYKPATLFVRGEPFSPVHWLFCSCNTQQYTIHSFKHAPHSTDFTDSHTSLLYYVMLVVVLVFLFS